MADNRDHERLFLVVSSDSGNALPPPGKILPPLPPLLQKARFSAIARAADTSPTQIGTALAHLRLDHPQETPSGVRTAGDGKYLERI
ncbi:MULTISPECIES: hypothetical protein [Sphingobium]|uniref:Uncharacterized protein n=1 Tax=Sphingobium cupriresistens TaxID=1132417 RepID=A0A8G1ZEW0_9SPHN|nr:MULTISPECIES: hypothetical protein [Sphingobium]RYM09772.1 hypothetical protein EWH12_13200 [Sphingobium cupriresistens]